MTETPARTEPALPERREEALTQLFAQERRGLIRLALGLVGDRGAAEDLVQDAFVALHRRWHALADRGTAAGYLRVSVLNGARSLNRRRAVFARLPLWSGAPEASAADATLVLAEEHRAVLDAVRHLPARQQQVVVLRYWFDMSERDIARSLAISTGTVKSSSSRALAAIQARLGGGAR